MYGSTIGVTLTIKTFGDDLLTFNYYVQNKKKRKQKSVTYNETAVRLRPYNSEFIVSLCLSKRCARPAKVLFCDHVILSFQHLFLDNCQTITGGVEGEKILHFGPS